MSEKWNSGEWLRVHVQICKRLSSHILCNSAKHDWQRIIYSAGLSYLSSLSEYQVYNVSAIWSKQEWVKPKSDSDMFLNQSTYCM